SREGSKDHGEKTTLANGKTTRAREGSKDHGEKTTLANGKTTRAPEASKDHGGKTTSAIGSFTLTTSHMELSSTMSETPGNKSHPYQNKDGSQRGLHAGGIRKNDSFPAWAIVIVVLVAVILFLMFLGLIILVSYMMKTRHALIQNKDNDPEDDGGPNSYSVHLMEQQTLGMGQIASPR
uniref:mucin-like protein 3 n=1 Tax=Halichoerus grypus TaxID=9711 RepID=UPI00165A0157